MDQIKKRLEIIKIAIFMSDDETIRLQLLKLEYFQENEQLDKILHLLKRKNYGQAQVLISEYLNDQADLNNKNIQEDKAIDDPENKKSIIEEFGLLKSNKFQGAHLSPVTNQQSSKPSKTKENHTSYTSKYKDFELSLEEIEKIPAKKQGKQEVAIKNKIDFSDIFLSSTKKKDNVKEEFKAIHIENISEIQEEIQEIDNSADESSKQENNEISQEKHEASEGDLEMLIDIDMEAIKAHKNSSGVAIENKGGNTYDTKYPPVSDVFHRFQNIALFHVDDKNYTLHKSAANWMHRISNFGYKEIEIFKISKYIQKLKEGKQFDEAIQLTLVCGATESNLGKLIFARELYKGDIFEKDHRKACEMTKELALLDYPEALCDLGQYCEHGIGTNKNLEYALHFYKKAHDLGLERANILYKNLKRKNGFFSFLFKSEH